MRKPAHTIRPDATIREAAAALRAFRIGCLTVLENGRLVGIVTAHDLLGVLVHLSAPSETGGASAA
jgi:acetoin utilization protein AcuB